MKRAVIIDAVRTPVANAFAERWIGSLRRELLDRTLIWNQAQLERIVTDYIDHYNEHRPHDSLGDMTPIEYRQHRTRNSTFELPA